ncbi:MAG TPA: AMIN domain-containing protein [Desulfomonilaceae bacterium]|nr:AMIN domain-containing protein [Desulfomonilaceae bacterium]
MRAIKPAAIFGILCLILVSWFGSVSAADRKILGVQISPDLRHITIKCDSPAGRHSSFVIQGPYRLVLDLDATSLGNVPSRISVAREPIREIRLGHSDSRARIAIDFGDHAVPPFTIDKIHNDIVVSMSGVQPPVHGLPAPQASQRLRDQLGVPKVLRPERHQPKETSGLSVKKSWAANNTVHIDLKNPKDPKQSHRLTIELDPDSMEPRQAVCSDSSGNQKKFSILAAKQADSEVIPDVARPAVGPRKIPVVSDNTEDPRKKFKWGLQSATQSSSGMSGSNAEGMPFRLEQFQLEERKTVATNN